MTKQVSIRESTPKIDGINVINGKKSYVRFHPADDDMGLSFLVNGEEIPVDLYRAYRHKIWRTLRLANCIAIRGEKERAYKAEHMLSAIYGLGIDNLVIELSDGVCPRQDNGVTEIIQALDECRLEGTSERIYLRVKDGLSEDERTVIRKGDEDTLTVNPSDDFVIDYTAHYPHMAVGHQRHRFVVSEENYKNEVMEARSIFFLPFGSRVMIDSPMRKIHGIRDSNSLLIGKKDNPEYRNTVRTEGTYGRDEFVRHKVLDVVGEVALTGRYFKDTEFRFDKTGHDFDIYGLRMLFDRGCFELCY